MYLREDTRKNKDGSSVTYIRLAHSVRDPKKGHSQAKILYNFGRKENLDVEQLKRLIKSIARFLPPEDELEVQAQSISRGHSLKWETCRSYGGIYFMAELWKKFNFEKLLTKHIHNRNYSTPIVQAVFAMVANRCLAPRSKLALTEWVEQDVFVPGLPNVDIQVVYRAMDFLMSHQKELEKEIYWSLADLLNLEVDLIFFDTTSTYFETDSEDELKKRGHSKDHRKDLPQVVVGLAVTRAGIPVRHWVFKGNTQDMSTIQTVKDDLSDWKLNRCIFVCDAGMGSDTNTRYLQRSGGHYIIGRKMKSGETDVEQALSQKGRYTEIAEDLWAKEVTIGNGERRKRLVLVKNIKEQKRHEQSREKMIAYLEEAISKVNKGQKKAQSKAALELRAHRIYGKYIKELKSEKLALDKTKLQSESRYDGKYMIESSDDTLDLDDIVLGYKQLYDVEHAFRTLKTTLNLRPNHHTKHDRIRCHIFLCFIALALVRISENATGKSWERIRRELNRIYYGEFKFENKTLAQLTELTAAQKSIFSALDVKAPSTVVDIRES
jgi:transposase